KRKNKKKNPAISPRGRRDFASAPAFGRDRHACAQKKEITDNVLNITLPYFLCKVLLQLLSAREIGGMSISPGYKTLLHTSSLAHLFQGVWKVEEWIVRWH
ncbi:MAG: hypothetical protein BJ554DRAFT_818, partial [Olpidium bornovanus]